MSTQQHQYVVHYVYRGTTNGTGDFVHRDDDINSLRRSIAHLKHSKHFAVTKIEHIVTTTEILDETSKFLGESES